MTNIEYYGFKNLCYITFDSDVWDKITEIYYVPKHNKKEHILLTRFVTSSQRDLVREKTKWLLSTPDILAREEKLSEKDLETFADFWLISA